MINTTPFSGNIRAHKNFQQNQVNQTPLNATRLAFCSENFSSIYEPSNKITQALKANALNFKGENAGMGGVQMQLPEDSPYDFNDIGELLRIIAGNETLIKDIGTLMKPLIDFKGQYHVRTAKAIIQEPDRKPLLADLISKFSDKTSSNFTLAKDITELLETFNPDSKLHNKVLKMTMATPGIHGANDILELLKVADENNINIMKKVLNGAKDLEIVNWLELKLIADEIINSPEKEPILDKLLKYAQPAKTDRTRCDLGDTLCLLETVDPKNPIHTEMLDFFLECNKGLWGTLIENFIEMATVNNKETIKKAVNDSTGTGMEVAQQIMATLKNHSFE